MVIKSHQIRAVAKARENDFLWRLDALLIPHVTAYAAEPDTRRLLALYDLTAQARQSGIREELNIGLFVLLALLVGSTQLSQPVPTAILMDPDRSSVAKIYQLWTWHRQQFPLAPIFATDGMRR